MTDTNLDQQQAEARVLQAKTGEEWAAAMNLHFNAVRNLQMTEIVPAFQNAVEGSFKREFDKLTRHMESSDRARFDRNHEIDARFDILLSAVQGVADSMGKQGNRIDTLDAVVSVLAKEFNTYTLASRRHELDAIKEMVDRHDADVARLEQNDLEQSQAIRSMKPFFLNLLSSEELEAKEDIAVAAAADLREFLLWFREYRDELLVREQAKPADSDGG
mgnify:CR=1 FL=1